MRVEDDWTKPPDHADQSRLGKRVVSTAACVNGEAWYAHIPQLAVEKPRRGERANDIPVASCGSSCAHGAKEARSIGFAVEMHHQLTT